MLVVGGLYRLNIIRNHYVMILIAMIWTVLIGILCHRVDSAPGQCSTEGGVPGPLLLTPLLAAGRIQEAQEASRVKLQDFPNFVSYSGFFTVNKQFNSNLFFWFFPAENGNKSAPVLLWLQGGPGSSSFYALFKENGPFSIGENLRLKQRNCSWASRYSVIYIDNPVGTGYSFTDPGGYSTNEYQIGDNLYSALKQFFTLFPGLQDNEFFVTGESFAGKYVPAVCYEIHERNPTAKLKINLQGFSIGNAWIDPESMMHYGDYLYQIGLLDKIGREVFKQKETAIVQSIQKKQWLKAFYIFDALINGDRVDSTIFQNLTGFSFYYNYLYTEDYTAQETAYIEKYLSTADVRKTLHVGNSTSTFQISDLNIEKYLLNDFMQSVKPWFEVLVENYRVLLYNGQLDILVAYPLSEAFLNTLSWSGAEDYRTAQRNMWYVGADLAGYSKTAKNLTFLLVRNAGHLVPHDQPEWAFDMITRFIDNKQF